MLVWSNVYGSPQHVDLNVLMATSPLVLHCFFINLKRKIVFPSTKKTRVSSKKENVFRRPMLDDHRGVGTTKICGLQNVLSMLDLTY